MTATPKLQPNHALDLFEKYLAAHNKSPNTICVYRYAVEQFYRIAVHADGIWRFVMGHEIFLKLVQCMIGR